VCSWHSEEVAVSRAKLAASGICNQLAVINQVGWGLATQERKAAFMVMKCAVLPAAGNCNWQSNRAVASSVTDGTHTGVPSYSYSARTAW